MKQNIFLPVYMNLENEVINLAQYLYFSDDQLKVYSSRIADLICRCVIEIETISKELYRENGGKEELFDENGKKRDIYFDTDCLEYLENLWNLSKKRINIVSQDFYFSHDKRIIFPLKKCYKRGSSGAAWNRAYQALKHDRSKSLKKATIENLIYALGALYILNLYYKDDEIQLYKWSSDTKDCIRAGSRIFSVSIYDASNIELSGNMSDDSIIKNKLENLEEAVYIVKYSDEDFKKIHNCVLMDFEDGMKKLQDPSLLENLKRMHGLDEIDCYKYCTLDEIISKFGGGYAIEFSNKLWMIEGMKLNIFGTLNKNEQIYPVLTMDYPFSSSFSKNHWGIGLEY